MSGQDRGQIAGSITTADVEGPIQGLESFDGRDEREGFRGSGIRSFGVGGLELRHRGWLR